MKCPLYTKLSGKQCCGHDLGSDPNGATSNQTVQNLWRVGHLISRIALGVEFLVFHGAKSPPFFQGPQLRLNTDRCIIYLFVLQGFLHVLKVVV